MARLGELIQKQGYYSLQNEKYACFLTAILAVFPLTAWLSLAVMALIVLRKSWAAGLKILITGMTVSICVAEIAGTMDVVLSGILLTYVTCYLASLLLRTTASWQIVVGGMVMLAATGVLLTHWLAPDYVIKQYNTLQAMLSAVDSNNPVVDMLAHQNAENKINLASSLLGIKAVSLIISVLFSLLLARAIQASLFNPGGFQREMLAFRASKIAVIALIVCVYGVHQGNAILLSCLPVFFVYLMLAGISLGLNLFVKKKRLVMMMMLLMPIILMPYVVLPVYVLFGSIDSLFNLRSRLPVMAGESQSKG
ncbi:hypothetical protein [Legionella spiritensis]|uniref:Membrane protein n=1 Tax=Legionella spiritensis TaxID=452 RepID=A0A0W0Z464_LEGSP|nr:hypothetical protein [Legionella spiritensis]KTD63930.1 membrane protein [Legionella spiritensis]SNV36623.1 membrane protein [Legionella spiritensis]